MQAVNTRPFFLERRGHEANTPYNVMVEKVLHEKSFVSQVAVDTVVVVLHIVVKATLPTS